MLRNRLRSLRKSKNITQEHLADILGMERSSVGKYESANITPSVDVLNKMADYFGVSIDYLLGRDDKEAPASSEGNNGDAVMYILAEILPKLPYDRKIALKEYAEYQLQKQNEQDQAHKEGGKGS